MPRKYTLRKNGRKMADVTIKIAFTKRELVEVELIAKIFGYKSGKDMLQKRAFNLVRSSIWEDFEDLILNEQFSLDEGIIEDEEAYFKAKEVIYG